MIINKAQNPAKNNKRKVSFDNDN